MTFLEALRNNVFWLVDALNGFSVKKHVSDIDFHIKHYHSTRAINIREQAVKNLLSHAIQSTSFYNDKGLNLNLQEFPVVNKNSIQSNLPAFKSKYFEGKKTFQSATSGSTGVPFVVDKDLNKKRRSLADTIYFGNLAQYKLGYKLLYLRIWDDYLRKSKFETWKLNLKAINVVGLDQDKVAQLISEIENQKGNLAWIGYASGFELLCKILDQMKHEPINSNVKSIIAISETLNDYTKERMSHYFKVPTLSRYSNWENGIIAQQTNHSGSDFVINSGSFFVEILKPDEDTTVNNGETGRIVVTDLFNYAMPLIRYDTGDIGAINTFASPPVLTSIAGRKSDIIYNTKGEIVSSLIMGGIIKYPGIIQAQLIQTSATHYILKLNSIDNFNKKAHLIKELKSYLGEDAEITVEQVNEIPILQSGKRKVTVNNHSQYLFNSSKQTR